jgi:predicted Zn finger-like uncharacterized protein
MDVKCERCNTEYEFDDALVSGRGTTVKCTNCGHKFKIRRHDADFSEDFWNVTTADNRTLVFTSLRELQRAIQTHLVERTDRLSRGGLPPKAIGQIPELAPFFDQRDAKRNIARNATHDGLGPGSAQMRSSRPPPPPGVASPALAAPPRARQTTKPEFPPPPGVLDANPPGKTTLIGTGPLPGDAVPAAPPVRARLASVPPPPTEREPEPDTTRFDRDRDARSVVGDADVMSLPASREDRAHVEPPQRVEEARPRPQPPPVPAMNRTVPMAASHPSSSHQRTAPPPVPRAARDSASIPPPLPDRARRPPPTPTPSIERARLVDDEPDRSSVSRSERAIEVSSPLPPPTPPVMRSLLAEIEDERDRVRGPSASIPDGPDGPVHKRRSVGGFIVAAVVVGCVLMLGAVWAQKNLGVTLGAKPQPTTPAPDPKVAGMLTTGEKALADGDLDQAKESFDKASVLAERDPRVLLDLARLAAARADIVWLKSRLLPADATDEHRITRDALSDLAAKARKAADDAMAVSADDPAAIRAKIDALRISGDRDGARQLVARVASSASQPESAYVLAALDLAEVEPLWSTVLERLRAAAGVETGPGRARAALVYALARSGDGAGAKAEVERLVAMPKAHPLLPLLRSFADKAKSPAAKLDGGVEGGTIAMGVDAGPVVVAPGPGGPQPVGLPSDPRELVRQAEKARAKGEYDRARTLYSAALDKNSNDSEALSGLAAISYAQHDLAGARASYKRVLAINPNYMPALIGLGDVDWDSGDKASAIKTYKDIVDRYPEGSYPARIKQRIDGGGG